MASTRLAAVLDRCRGVSCADARPAAAPPTPVDAIGRDRARPAIPAGATIETQVDVAHAGVGARSGRLQGGPQPPAARSASNGAQGASPGVGVVSTGRSGGRSTLPTALTWPVISASMCRCRRVSTGPAARRAAHQPARGAAQGPPAIPPAPPLSSRPPARAGGPIGTRARAFWEFHRTGKRGTMGKGLRGKAKSENGRSADPPQRRNGITGNRAFPRVDTYIRACQARSVGECRSPAGRGAPNLLGSSSCPDRNRSTAQGPPAPHPHPQLRPGKGGKARTHVFPPCHCWFVNWDPRMDLTVMVALLGRAGRRRQALCNGASPTIPRLRHRLSFAEAGPATVRSPTGWGAPALNNFFALTLLWAPASTGSPGGGTR